MLPSRTTQTTHLSINRLVTYRIFIKKIISRGKAKPSMKENKLVGKIKKRMRMRKVVVTTSDAPNINLEVVVPTLKQLILYQVSTNRRKEAQHKSRLRLIEMSAVLSETAPSK